jgi:hypothetical protein
MDSVIGRKRKKIWPMSLLVAFIGAALLFWLEWLGSEQPLVLKEIPAQAPAEKTGSHN